MQGLVHARNRVNLRLACKLMRRDRSRYVVSVLERYVLEARCAFEHRIQALKLLECLIM
jgi:hypothetical protein